MGSPWEKYQSTSAPTGKPWEKYGDTDGSGDTPWYSMSGSGMARGALDALPLVGGAAGGVMGAAAGSVVPGPGTALGGVGGASLGYAGGKELSDFLKAQLLGDKPTSAEPLEQVKRVGENLKDGAMMDMGGQALGAGVGKAADALADTKLGKFASDKAEKAALWLKSKAENTAVNATGATGKQIANFEPDAGRQLLDRKLVRAGDSQGNIADRVSGAMDSANGQIDNALIGLDQKGVKVDRNDIYNTVRDKINALKGDESQADVAKALEEELNSVITAADHSGTEVGISKAEQIKRGYNRKAGDWANPDKSQAGKEMYQTYRGAVEDAAQAADPAAANAFKEGKSTYGLLAPIQEAAERRAATQGQSPWGGLGDMVAAIKGSLLGGPAGGIAAVGGRRVIAPRLASTAAVTLDSVSKMLMQSPRFAEMAQSNPQAFRAMASTIANKMGSAGGEALKAAGTDGSDQNKMVSEDEAKQKFIQGN